ncbi:MAG TPA: molybdopterin-dependent oxidoreductase [Candidatus Acidoferrum sp.]|nr:molybdopterin-dependent oxidoreductase [Candidatus Acidoferrum sp.]
MQVFRQHKKIVIIAVLLVVILIVSLFIVHSASKLSPSPAPTPNSPSNSPTPIRNGSPTPTVKPTPTSTQKIGTTSPRPTPVPSLSPGEITQYQNQSLTPISAYIQDLFQHPDVSINGVQYINQTTYRLIVSGLVNKTIEYTYGDIINNFPLNQKVAKLLCVEGWSVTMLWQGVLVSSLLQDAGASPNATTIIFSASDGYTTELPLAYIVQNNLILAYKINNVTLTPQLGFPFMLAAQNQYGYKWIMWVNGIEVSNDTSYLGYWESRGYPDNATVS